MKYCPFDRTRTHKNAIPGPGHQVGRPGTGPDPDPGHTPRCLPFLTKQFEYKESKTTPQHVDFALTLFEGKYKLKEVDLLVKTATIQRKVLMRKR